MKKFWAVLLVAGSLFLFWYFVVKDYDYRINFKNTSSPAVLFTSLDYWRHMKLSGNINVNFENYEPFSNYTYSVKNSAHQISYDWEFDRISDSLTEVTIFAKDQLNSLKQKITVPFKKNAFVLESTEEVKDFISFHNDFKKGFNIEIKMPATHTFKETYYAYISSKGEIKNKAHLMLESIGSIMAYLKGNNIALNGDPFLIVKSWNDKTGKIEFDFCFPILKSAQKPAANTIKFGYLKTFQALMADYHGNYRDSNIAWNVLLEYATENDISIEPLPIEIYRDDPHNGGNPLDWTAEIYFPLKTSS